MQPIEHSLCNAALGPPPGDDSVQPLPIFRGIVGGCHAVQSFWRPEPDELAALNAGHPVLVTIVGRTHTPISIEVAAVKE